ncbi:MAG: RraA family protein [Acidimicrobiia bacterium]
MAEVAQPGPPRRAAAQGELQPDRWLGLPTAMISDCLGRLGAMDAGIKRYSGKQLAGVAFTVETGAGDSATIHRALEVAPAGAVLVVDAGGHLNRAVWGYILTVAAVAGDLRGLVLDGAVRDLGAIRETGFPVFARAVCPAGPHKGLAGRIGATIQCGSVAVSPGDLVVGDDDGVVVVPHDRSGHLLKEIEARRRQEEEWVALIRAGAKSAKVLGLAPADGSTNPGVS